MRGLVAAGGFNVETAAAIESFHESELGDADAASADAIQIERRRLISERYSEYGAIGEAGGASGAVTAALRLGEAGARRLVDDPSPDLASWLGGMHEAIAEGVVDLLRHEA